jgi:hypothetical protein
MKLNSIDAAGQLANLPTRAAGGQLAAFNWKPLAAVFSKLFYLQNDENLVSF